MNKNALVLIGLLLLIACDDGKATAVPTPTVLFIEATETALPPAYPAPVTAVASPTHIAPYPGPIATMPLPVLGAAYPIHATETPPPIPVIPTPPPPPSVPNQSNGDSFQPHISADGRTITFLSAGFLTYDKDAAVSVYVRDQISQTTTLVNAGFTNYSPQISVHGATISANGRVIAYYSQEGNLVPGDEMDCGSETRPMSCEDLFIHDRDTGLTERIPLGRGNGLGGDYTLALSANGRYLAYGSTIYDRETGQTETIPTLDEQPPNSDTFGPRFAANGDLAFVSRASNLVSGADDDFFDVFVWERPSGQISRISAGDADSGMSSAGEGYWSEMAISGDGRFIAYASTAANLTADAVNECEDWRGYDRTCTNIFLHDRETGQTRLITPNSNGDSNRPSLSGDGRFLTFTSIATNLTDDGLTCDLPTLIHCGQVYLHDTQTSQTTLISRAPDGVPGNGSSYQAVMSGDGRFIAYASNADNLILNDTNDVSDIFRYDRETGQTERISLTYIGPPPDLLPDLDTDSLFSRLIFRDVAGASLRQLHIAPYGLRRAGYCQHGPYRWLDNGRLLIFPVIGYDFPAGLQTTQPVVVALDDNAWAADSPPTGGCDVPVWSSTLERLVEVGNGEVRLRDLEGRVTAVYEGNYPLHIAPSGRRLLAGATWIDLETQKTVSFSDKSGVRSPRPAWTSDEQRVFTCCFSYGDATTGDYWNRNGFPGFTRVGMGVPPGYVGPESHWVGGDTQILIRSNKFVGANDQAAVPLIDPTAQTHEDIVQRLGLPDTVTSCGTFIAPDSSRFWLSCWDRIDNMNTQRYDPSYLVTLPTLGAIPVTGKLAFRGWSADSHFMAYGQLDDERAHVGTTWLMDVNGNRRQIDNAAAWLSHWHPTDPIAAFRFEDKQRILFIHAAAETSRELMFDVPIAGLVWRSNGDGATVWGEDGRIYHIPHPLNPTSQSIPLTPPLPDVHTVRWSPDGTRLAFVSGTDLYVVEVP